MRSSKPITVTLGKQQASLEAWLESGEYESASEVVRAGLRALEREKAALDDLMRRKVQEARDDPRPLIPLDDVFARLREHHAKRVTEAKKNGL
jgi:antitoxin ParD1/3/4